jgi:hypothetical protein
MLWASLLLSFSDTVWPVQVGDTMQDSIGLLLMAMFNVGKILVDRLLQMPFVENIAVGMIWIMLTVRKISVNLLLLMVPAGQRFIDLRHVGVDFRGRL